MPKGGKRKGSGRKPNWFKEECLKRLRRPQVLGFIDKVIDGAAVDPHVTKEGIVRTEARPEARLDAIEFLRDTGMGKPASVLDVGNGEQLFLGVVAIPPKDLGEKGEVKDA